MHPNTIFFSLYVLFWIYCVFFNQINKSDWSLWSINKGQWVNRWRSESSCSELTNWISISLPAQLVNSLIAWRGKGTRNCSSWHALWCFPVWACLSLWYPPSAVCKTSHLYTVTSRSAFIYQVTTMQITCRRFGRSNYQSVLWKVRFHHFEKVLVMIFSSSDWGLFNQSPTVTLRHDSTVC